MGVWNKIFTAIKGGVNEAAEGVIDSQSLRILEQEIREAREELRRSDEALVSIIAKGKMAQQKIDALTSSVSEYEDHARQAATKGEQQLALECAQRVGKLKAELDGEQAYRDQFSQSEQSLRSNIASAKDKLKQLEQQLDIVKATETVQKAQAAVSSRNVGANAKMRTAVESLDRIKQKQAERQAKLEASAEQLAEESGDALSKKLQQAGIASGGNTSAEDELARILGNK